ncbi:MAG: selenocysteine-specific translation elongation factor [Deltaproteobacteria bacterium]|nr:selenocysteine-specific translation elongation factor [Deltaproteobacteria bacterium]
MSAGHIVVGTAGHIDHGKTSLVKALTGVDTDRLPEEKRRGITIELGFASWPLSPSLTASVVDVPGHERLVRTMVAGAAGIDIALLVIAADDGVMPQTREHLDILRLLRVPAGVCVLTKADLVDAELLELVMADIRQTVGGTLFEHAPLVCTSAKTGLGLAELTQTVAALATKHRARAQEGPVFLPLDRLFTKAGYGTVGTGTVLRGRLAVGDGVEAHGDTAAPVTELKVRGLQSQGAAVDVVTGGMRAAVNLTGRDVAGLSRGMVLAHPGVFPATGAAVASVEVLKHATPLGEETLIAHLGTTEREAAVIPLNVAEIEPGQAGGVLLRFAQPVAAFAGERLVLRRPGLSSEATVAGGEILDPEPPRGRGRVALAASQLEALCGPVEDRLLAIARESRSLGVTRAAIERRLPPPFPGSVLLRLLKREQLIKVPGAVETFVDAVVVSDLIAAILALVAKHHESAPMSAGVPEAEVQSQLPRPEQPLAALAVERAVAGKKLVRDGALLAIPGRGATLSAEGQRELSALCDLHRQNPYQPPSDTELAAALGLDRKRVHELLSLARRQGALVRISEALHYDAATLGVMREKLVQALEGKTGMTASELKGALNGLSRKWMIPVLEYFDRSKVTLRTGDLRQLHPSQRKG